MEGLAPRLRLLEYERSEFMPEKIVKQVCKCASCGNEAEMMVTCSLEFEERAPAAPAAKSNAATSPSTNRAKGHAVCSHCGNEADIWVET